MFRIGVSCLALLTLTACATQVASLPADTYVGLTHDELSDQLGGRGVPVIASDGAQAVRYELHIGSVSTGIPREAPRACVGGPGATPGDHPNYFQRCQQQTGWARMPVEEGLVCRMDFVLDDQDRVSRVDVVREHCRHRRVVSNS